MKKLLIAVVLMGLSVNAYALRCGTDMVHIGDPLFKVLDKCRMYNTYGDYTLGKIYINANGVVYKLKFVDDELKSIDWSRF